MKINNNAFINYKKEIESMISYLQSSIISKRNTNLTDTVQFKVPDKIVTEVFTHIGYGPRIVTKFDYCKPLEKTFRIFGVDIGYMDAGGIRYVIKKLSELI